MKRTGFAPSFFSKSILLLQTKRKYRNVGEDFFLTTTTGEHLLAPGNTQSNRRILISSLQGRTTLYVSRYLLSHLPISKKDILQWMKIKILCLEAKHNANNMQLLVQVTNSSTQALIKITCLPPLWQKPPNLILLPCTNTTLCSTGTNWFLRV